jgi:hypothetical protein
VMSGLAVSQENEPLPIIKGFDIDRLLSLRRSTSIKLMTTLSLRSLHLCPEKREEPLPTCMTVRGSKVGPVPAGTNINTLVPQSHSVATLASATAS